MSTMSSDDEIYVDVVPRLSERDADKAVDELKGKFSHAGDSIKDSLSHALGSAADHVKDLGPTLRGALGDSLKGGLADALGGHGGLMNGPLGDIGAQLGKSLGSAISDPLHGLASQIGVDLDTALSKALNKDWGGLGGELGKGIGSKIASGLGIDDDVADRVQSVLGAYQNAHAAVSGLTDTAVAGLGGFAGGKGASILGGLAEPVGVAAGVSGAASAGHSWIEKIQEAHPAAAPWLTPLGDVASAIAAPFDEAKGVWDWATGANKPAGGASPSGRGSAATVDANGGGSRATANEVDVQSSVATISAGTVVLGGNISLPGTGVRSSRGSSSPSGRGSAATADANGRSITGDLLKGMGLPPHSGGGMLPGDSPGQDNTLFSGEGGEFVVNPQATQNNLGILQAINGGAKNSGGPNFNEQNSNGPQDQQKMGEGSGFGLTGSGLIGFAESLPSMAAGAGGSAAGAFGGGAAGALASSAWSNIAQPEINEAVKKGTQIGAAALLAPLESTWLGGGQMGAPTVGSPDKAGWTGKLLGSLLGSQFSTPNMAGAFAPPKDAQKDDQKHDDPGSAGKSGSGKGGAPAGPTGHADDPIHTAPAPGSQPSPGPGGATSQMSGTATMAGAGL